jgi:hypothetical protein
MDTMRSSRIAVAAVGTLLWLVAALAIDRWLLSRYCGICTDALALELKLKMPAAEISYPPVSFLVLLCVPMLVLALWLIPWRDARNKDSWRKAVARWTQPLFWLGVGVVLAILGESLYLVIKQYLPQALTSIAEAFSVTATVKAFKEHAPIAITASLSGVIGLCIGFYLFFSRGLDGIFDR